MVLGPFWRYYGGKWKATSQGLYPPPDHDIIIEPFAGAAGYSCHYPDRQVVLVEKYYVVAEIWKWLISVSETDFRSLPVWFEDLSEVNCCQEARWFLGFWASSGSATPRSKISKWRKDYPKKGWTPLIRDRLARYLQYIRHWQVISGDWKESPDKKATWFIDPPYCKAGKFYLKSQVDYGVLGDWARSRLGQVIVCEASGADWLPFIPVGRVPGQRRHSNEVAWFFPPRSEQLSLEV